MEQRKELALAFVSNSEAQKDSRRDLDNDPYFRVDGYAYFSTRERWSTVWKLALKWPPDSGVPRAVFQNISTEDQVKAEVYRGCKDAHSRYSILEGCSLRDQETIKLGLNDPDGTCRFTACEKIWWINLGSKALEAILSSDDKDSLTGLSRNESLPVEILEKVAVKFEGLGDYLQESIARRTMARVQEKQEQAREDTGESDAESESLQPQVLEKEVALQFEALREQFEPLSEQFEALRGYLEKMFETLVGYLGKKVPTERMSREKSVTFNRSFLILVLLATGAVLLLGAPLGAALGLGLIGVALAFILARSGSAKTG